MKSTLSCGGKNYFITFIDDYTRYCYVYFLNDKDDAKDAFRQYKTENQLYKKIKMIKVIDVENINLHLRKYVSKKESSIKLLLLNLFNLMELRKKT